MTTAKKLATQAHARKFLAAKQASLDGIEELPESNSDTLIVNAEATDRDLPELPYDGYGEDDDDRQLTLPDVRPYASALPRILTRIAMSVTEIEHYAREGSTGSKVIEHELFSSDKNVKAFLTGNLLTPEHMTLYRCLMRLCRRQPLNVPLVVPYADVFRDLEMSNDGSKKKRVQELLSDLSRSNLRLLVLDPETKKLVEMNIGFLKATFQFGEDSTRFEVTFDVKGVAMVGEPNQLAYQPWKERLQLSSLGQNVLDKISARRRDAEVKYNLDVLRMSCGYNSPIDKFKKALAKILTQLAEMGVVAPGWKIEGRGVKATLTVTYVYRPGDRANSADIVSNVEVSPLYAKLRQSRPETVAVIAL